MYLFFILQDYAFDFHGSVSMEIFTGCCDYPDGHILLESWHQHRQPLLHLINEAGRGFTGVVQDQEMQKPMENATVTIIGSSRNISVDSNGRFHIYLPPGHHYVVFHCHGYQDFRKVYVLKVIFYCTVLWKSLKIPKACHISRTIGRWGR